LPRADYPRFQRWAIELTSVAANWDRGVAASEALRDYFAGVMEETGAPGDDLISDLVRVEVEGTKLTDEEIYSFLRLLLPAGVETTYRATGNLLFALLNDRAQFDALYKDRSLFPQAFEEALRWEPPVTVILRRATKDTELAGVKIEAGADVALILGAANRDERKYTDPDRLRHVPRGAPARRLRVRCPRLPRHAPGPHGVARRHQHVVRPPGPFTLDPAAGAPAHRGHGLPLAALAAGGVRRRLTDGAWHRAVASPVMAQTHRPVLQDAAAIVGIGQTEFAKQIDRPESQLAAEAVVAALRDAGIAPGEVDGLSSYTMETTDEVTMAKNIGAATSRTSPKSATAAVPVAPPSAMPPWPSPPARPTWWWPGARASGARAARARGRGAYSSLPIQAQWTRPYGLLRPVDEVAMLARRYMHEYGGRREQLAEVAMAIRAHANRNPAALMYDKTMSLDDYMAARFISEPLCLFDNCLETDGALAVVLVSAERARDCPHPPALVHAFGQGLHRQHETMVNYYSEDPLTGPAWSCRPEAVVPVRVRSAGCGRGADLRRLHPADPALAGGVRVLRARRGR
jgi:hypothetical protein